MKKQKTKNKKTKPKKKKGSNMHAQLPTKIRKKKKYWKVLASF